MGMVERGSHGQVVGKGVIMRDIDVTARESTDDFVHFHAAGARVKGEFHCSECGYGVTVYRTLPVCPMCGGAQWEQSAWSPLSRARTLH
jgi:rubrerythrin